MGGFKRGFRTLNISAGTALEEELVTARLAGRSPSRRVQLRSEEDSIVSDSLTVSDSQKDRVEAMRSEIKSLLEHVGLGGDLRRDGDHFALQTPLVGRVSFSVLYTELHYPNARERTHASSLGVDPTGSALRARRGTTNEEALLRFRAEQARLAEYERYRPRARTDTRDVRSELIQRAAECFEALDVDASIDDDVFVYRSSIVANAEATSGGFLIRTAVQSFQLPLDSEVGPAFGPETFDAVQALVRRFDPLISEADSLCRSARDVGLTLMRERAGLRSERGLISLNGAAQLPYLVAPELPDFLRRTVERHLAPLLNSEVYSFGGTGTSITVTLKTGGLVATIRPTNADVGDRHVVGDFLGPGSSWHELAAAVREVKVPERPHVLHPRMTLPGGIRPDVPPGLEDACLQASENIRLHRTAAFGTTVSVMIGDARVTFQPVERVAAGHVAVSDGASLVELGRVYALVLLGFEALTVRPEFAVETSRTSLPRRSYVSGGRRRTPMAPTERQIRPRSGSSRYSSWATLEPLGATRIAHWVVGHIRELAHGWEASAEAAAEAAAVGIRLGPGQTWVRPHVRGLAPGESLTFRWHASPQITDALAVVRHAR